MGDFNIKLAATVRRQNMELADWHIVGVGNVRAIMEAPADLKTLTNQQRFWLSNVKLRATSIKQGIEHYKQEIRSLIETCGADCDTSRASIYLKKLDAIIEKTRMIVASAP